MKFSNSLIEKCIFFIALLLSVLPAIVNHFYPTLDGPSHIYNSKLLTYYFSNSTVNQFFNLNKTPSPNLFSHAFLTFFVTIFSSAVAEKILVLSYFILFPVSLRFLIKKYNPSSVGLSLLAIPLSHAALFYFGFYNFSISVIFLMFGIGFYYNNIYKKNQVHYTRYLMLFLLITVTYFSAILSYFCLLALLSVYELRAIYKLRKQHSTLWKTRLYTNILMVLPTLLCFLFFKYRVTFPAGGDAIPFTTLLSNLLAFKSLIVYGFPEETLYSTLFSMILLFLVGYVAAENKFNLKFLLVKNFDSTIFLLLTMFTLVLYFIVPDGSQAGMMSDRFLYLFSVFLIFWIVCQQNIIYPKMFGLVFLIPHFLLLQLHSKKINEYNELVVAIANSAAHIKENSTVLPVNLLTKWMFSVAHFPNYLGINKPLIILENYEADMPWFPLNWDKNKMPYLTLNGKSNVNGVSWITAKDSSHKKEIDYIYILGEINDITTQENWHDLNVDMDNAYRLHFADKRHNIYLYKHK